MYAKFAVRDGAFIAVAWAVWWLVAESSAGGGWVADLTGFGAGLLVGGTAFVLHEWGHLAGALVSRSVLHLNHDLRAPFIYSFDARKNSLKQFVSMSLGGFVATAVLVISFYLWLPDDLLASRVARGAALFLAFLGVTLEVPLFVVALVTRRVPAVAAVKVRRERPEFATEA